MEKQLQREEIYNGKVIHVVKDVVELDDGHTSIREVVLHNGGACIALKHEGSFFLVRQYRYSLGKDMWEFPAGKIEKGEDPMETVLRETIEETGYEAKNVHDFGYIVPTCGYCSEKIYLYYGESDGYVGQDFDPDENIELKRFSFAELEEMVRNGEIDDGKTIALMYRIKMEGLDE